MCVCVLLRTELRVAFAMVDKDADGRITPRELMSVMTGLGFKSHDVLVKEMIARFDADGICLLLFRQWPLLTVTAVSVSHQTTQANSASYPQRDGKWVPATVR